MKDIEKYRHTLKQAEIAKYTAAVVGASYRTLPKRTFIPMIDDLITKLNDIDRADFTENTNPNHREEQPF